MRVVVQFNSDSRRMVEIWRKGQLYAVVPFDFFVDVKEDPANQLITKLAEGKIIHMELTFHSEVIPEAKNGFK